MGLAWKGEVQIGGVGCLPWKPQRGQSPSIGQKASLGYNLWGRARLLQSLHATAEGLML